MFVLVPFIPGFAEALGDVCILSGLGIGIGWACLALCLAPFVLILIHSAGLAFPGERVITVKAYRTIVALIHNACASQSAITIIKSRAPEHGLIYRVKDNACVVTCGVVSIIKDASIADNVMSDKILARLAELAVFVAVAYLEREVGSPVSAL